MSGFDIDAAVGRRMGNLVEMMYRLQLDPDAASRQAGGAVIGSAIRVCEACAAGDVCRDWLLRAAKTLYKAPPFCPNADRFAQLFAEELRERRCVRRTDGAKERDATSGETEAVPGRKDLIDVARKCFLLAETCTDRDVALALDKMGRGCLDKARHGPAVMMIATSHS